MVGYFPQGVWYDISDDSPVDASTAGRFVKLPAPLGHLPVHVLGGAVVPMQVSAFTHLCRSGVCVGRESWHLFAADPEMMVVQTFIPISTLCSQHCLARFSTMSL